MRELGWTGIVIKRRARAQECWESAGRDVDLCMSQGALQGESSWLNLVNSVDAEWKLKSSRIHASRFTRWIRRLYAANASFQLFPESIFANSLAMASPTSLVVDLPRMSAVRMPLSIVRRTASSIAFASAGSAKEYWRSIAMERIAATGFTTPFPAMSGAEPGEKY